MCLLKKIKTGRFEFCKDDLGFERYSGHKIMECLREHNVEHCIDCSFYPSTTPPMG